MTSTVLYSFLFWLSSISLSPLMDTASSPVSSPLSGPGIHSLKADHPNARIVMDQRTEVPRIISGISVPTRGDTPRAQAEDFLARFGDITGAAAFRYSGESKSRNGVTVRFEQLHQGDPVLDRNLVIQVDGDGRVRSVVSDLSPIQSSTPGNMVFEAARRLALETVGVSNLETRTSRGWSVLGMHGTPIIEVEFSRLPLADHLVVRIDAHEGQVLSISNRVLHEGGH